VKREKAEIARVDGKKKRPPPDIQKSTRARAHQTFDLSPASMGSVVFSNDF